MPKANVARGKIKDDGWVTVNTPVFDNLNVEKLSQETKNNKTEFDKGMMYAP